MDCWLLLFFCDVVEFWNWFWFDRRYKGGLQLAGIKRYNYEPHKNGAEAAQHGYGMFLVRFFFGGWNTTIYWAFQNALIRKFEDEPTLVTRRSAHPWDILETGTAVLLGSLPGFRQHLCCCCKLTFLHVYEYIACVYRRIYTYIYNIYLGLQSLHYFFATLYFWGFRAYIQDRYQNQK
jgi:hypothetical protein